MRPGHGLGIAAEDDVGSAAGHVRGDGHRAQAAGLGDDLGLALVMLGVEDLVRNAALFQQTGDQFAPLDRDGAHQDRPPAAFDFLDFALGDGFAVLAAARLKLDVLVGFVNDLAEILLALVVHQHVPLVHPLDFVGDGHVLFVLGAIDHVGIVEPLQRLVRGDGDHVELVDLPELGGLGHGGAGHAADLVVELEEVLQRDRGERLVFFLDADAFLGLDGLVQTVAPVAARHQAAGELVDDHHFLAVDHVVDVALVEVVGLQGVVDQVRPFHVAGRVEALDARQLLGRPNALVGQVRRVLLLVDLEMPAFLQLPGDSVGLGVSGDVVVRGTGDDQRRPRLVDQNVVHLVDDGEVQRALRLLIPLVVAVVAVGRRTHVVAQIVEPELVVRAVGDVAVVGLLPVGGLHVALDRADGQPQRHVERAHPFHVAAGEVVVDRDHVDALALQGVQIGRQGGHQRLSFAGDHFGDVAAVQDDAAHQLHVVVAQAEHAAAGLAADGERLDQQVVQRFAGGQPLAELDRLLPQFGVGHRLVFRLQGVDRVDQRLELLHDSGRSTSRTGW